MIANANQPAEDNSARELVITRSFAAPRELVWEAWADPRHLARWWCPEGFTIPVCEVEHRPGGALRIVMRGPDGADYPMRGTFHEIVPPERLVFTSRVEDDQGRVVLEVRNTVTLAARGDGTLLTLHAQPVTVRDAGHLYLQGMEQGWAQSLEKLAALLAEMQAGAR